MNTFALLRPFHFIRWLPVCAATFWLAADTPGRAEKFSTAPQREAVDKAVGELDKATEKASKAQQKAPTDAGQQGINGAEDAADAARDAANVAKDKAEQAREEAAEKARSANTPKEVEEAKAAEKAGKDAAEKAASAEKTAKEREADAKKAVDEQVKADKGENHGRRPVHDARQEKRDARRRLADRIRELRRVWADTKIDPKKKGVTITEEERRATERKINEGRRELGLGEIEILAALPVLPANSLCSLVAAQKIQADVTGTGKTIGHIATIRVKNLTAEKISVTVPPLVLESKSGKHQHYVCPRAETIALTPQEEKFVKARGICVARSKPPVGDGVGGDLVINDGSGTGQGTVFPPAQVDKLIRGVTSYYDGADKLEKEGRLAKVPYKDPEMRREIVTQWGVWSDPKICTITKETPATKEDLTKTVLRQTEERTPVTPEIKKKLETGITDIFASVQLTTKEAKDLETATSFADAEVNGDAVTPPGVINISDPPPAGGTTAKPASNPPAKPPGSTPPPRAEPEVPVETVLADTIGALMNRQGLLQNALRENPELAAKVERWLRARERMDRATRHRESRVEAAKNAQKMRDNAWKLRTAARSQSNPQIKASMEATAETMSRNAAELEKAGTLTPEERQESREAAKEFHEAQSAVPEHIKAEVDNALKEQANPPPREAQERMEIGPDGRIIESPSKR